MKQRPLLFVMGIVMGILFLLWPRDLKAVPYFAVLFNTQCSNCHINPTGAGMRSDRGVMSYDELPFKKTKELLQGDFKGRLNKHFAVGGDFYLRHLSTVQSPTSNSFTIPQGSFDIAVDPISHFTLYTDTDLANVVSREAFGLIHDLPQGMWVKFGRFSLPYGLRIPDDSSFIRSDLGLTFAAQDIGLEVGAEPGPVTLAIALSNGVGGGAADDNNAKAVSWFSEWRSRLFRLGGSFQYNSAAATRSTLGGGHAGLHLWNLALLGEFDAQKILNKTTGLDRTVLVGYGETDYKVMQGLILKAIYDGTDDQLAGSGLHHRISGGVELYPIPYLETSLLYRARIGSGLLGTDQLLVFLHGYF